MADARVTVFGAGAMGTALAMHLARVGNDTVLWASQFDEKVLPVLVEERRHPNLPEHLPDRLRVLGPDELAEAALDVHVAVMGAHSGGARTLARIVRAHLDDEATVVSLAKGLEPETGKRMSEVYGEEAGHGRVVIVAGPCLAAEVAEELPSAVVFACGVLEVADDLRPVFDAPTYRVHTTDDLVGVEYCTVLKNVAAIGIGILDGLGQGNSREYRNARSALFTQAVGEQTRLISALGGRPETVAGLAGLGDTLVTSLGGRNRLYGELLGAGSAPQAALEGMVARGMTVEGVESARDVHELAAANDLSLRLHETVYRIVHEGEDPRSVLECLE